MYSIHTTPGLIIDSRPYGEAGKMLSIFTRDLGLIMATAQGIRFEKSKLRYHSQDYSMGVYSFVRGKEFWRLTNTQEGEVAVTGKSGKELTARIASLLKRLLQGEESHPDLFECLAGCAGFLESNQGLADQRLQSLESIVVLRILNTLGYIGTDRILAEYIRPSDLTIELLEKAVPARKAMNQHINKALRESHL